jgi:pimeloyl-ACP methyl ester carboxylesterase
MTVGRKLLCLALIVALRPPTINCAIAQTEGQGPAPELVMLATKDGVQLKATYFPSAARKGTPQAQQVTPVVLLHDFKSSRSVLTQLALKLQSPGEGGADHPLFAAITVDLRGHGESTKQLAPGGVQSDLDASKLAKEGLLAMASLDMEAVRNFLVEKNDAGELNLNKLCLVGSGMGGSVAANWALQDWTAPPLAIGKQGQDVKAIVLISPRWSYNGLSMQAPMKFAPLKQGVAWLLMCGAQDPKVKTDLERIQKQLERFHPTTDKGGAPHRAGLEVVALPSSLQSDSLFNKFSQSINEQTMAFLTENVAAKQQPWTNRRNRLP